MNDSAPRKKRRPRGVRLTPLNLAPLIDINANLLFFLIIANSVQEDRLQAGRDVELPVSSSQSAEAGDLISIVVGLQSISVNERQIVILDAGAIPAAAVEDKGPERIAPLYRHLTERFQELVRGGAQSTGPSDDNRIPVILLQVDRRLPYATLAKIMRTCGEAGFTRFRFAAQGGG
jgi:biopolymer transport protein TolR